MHKKRKLIVISFLIIILLISGIFIYNNVIEKPKSKILSKEELKNQKVLKIKYLAMNKNKDKYSLKEVFPGHYDDFLAFNIEYLPLERDGKYYKTSLKNKANNMILSNIVDYAFAMNNNNAEVLDDCIFDKEKLEIKIPEKYYKESNDESIYGATPVQIEVMSRITNKEIKNLEIKVKEKNIFTHTQNVKRSGTTDEFLITNLEKRKSKDINIYVNDLGMALSNKYYEYDNKKGTIKFNISPSLVDNVRIEYKNKLVKGVSASFTYEDLPEDGYFEIKPLKTKPTVGALADVQFVAHSVDWYSTGSTGAMYDDVPIYGGYSIILGADNGETGDVIWANPKKYSTSIKDSTQYAVEVNMNKLGFDVYDDDDDVLIFATDCVHITKEQNTENIAQGANLKYNYTYNFKVKVTDVTEKDDYVKFTIYLMLDWTKYYFSGVDGDNSIGQTILTKLNLKYRPDENYKLTVQKELLDGETTLDFTNNNEKFDINLYSNSKCTKQIATEKTDDSGMVVFSSDNATYGSKITPGAILYIGETLTPAQQNNWKPLKKCQKVKLSSTQKVNNYYIQSAVYKNRKIKYCFNVKKKDAETGAAISGITFKVGNDSKTTSTSGIVTYQNLEYKNYVVEETSTDGTVGYWNDSKTSSRTHTVTSSNLTEMSYDSTNGYTCSGNNVHTYTKSDHKIYYCLRAQKEDAVTKEKLTATFKLTCPGGNINITKTTGNGETGNDPVGVVSFYLGTYHGTDCTIEETVAPAGYALPNPATKSVDSSKITQIARETTNSDASSKVYDTEICSASATDFSFDDSKLLINWYKVTENGTRENGATFKVKTGSDYITVKSTKESQTDANGVEKTCYVYDGKNTTGSTLTSYNAEEDVNGEVCVIGLPEGTYTVEEIDPGPYHTFGSTTSIDITASTVFSEISDKNKFVNYETYFEFTKNATTTTLQVDTEYYNKTTEELKEIEFNVMDSSNTVLSFIETTKDNKKVYSYSGNTIDKPTGTAVTALHLDDLRKIRIEHLPVGTYSIKEKDTKVCDNSSTYTDCIGYYYPEYNNTSDYQFTITACSNTNATSCTSAQPATQSLTNEPTMIEFTKKDFYNYEDAADIVDFENDAERNDFDRIDFKIKDSNNNYLTLKEVGTSGSCLTDSGYREYRYEKDATQVDGGTVLHTCGGHIKITNLCRGNTYTVEEIAVPEDSVFVKENTESTPTEVQYTIPCKKSNVDQTSNTKLINDKGTRVRFEKRDSKYHYLIPDETTTFEVYKCKKGTKCHPTENKDENGKIMASEDYELVKFAPRAVIANDQEDPTDIEGISGVEVYRAMSDSDVKAGSTTYVTELHPYNGILVLRYLQSGYDYVLVETVAPKNYKLPVGRNAETEFTVRNDTVQVDEIDVPNKPTSILIKKYSSDGNLLTGAKFKIYEGTSEMNNGTTCDLNLSAMNQPKRELKLKTVRDGVYENRPVQDTSVITTCTDTEDSKCSNIPVNENTKLTYTDYMGSWAEYGNALGNDEEKDKYTELQEGEALIQYLEYGHCYIIEEVKAPKGYSLPEDDARFTMLTIKENDSYEHTTEKTLINTPTPFTFYKFDEYNQLLDGAEFKLQKLDNNKKYQDITVSEEEKDGKLYYKVDKDTENKTIKTKNGSATVYYLEEGQYRIIETKPAEGKELTKNPNIATFFVDNNGSVFGNSIIVNKEKTKKIEIVSKAQAELIITPASGQTVIKYGLIITILLAAITGLIILKKKTK